MRGVFLAAFLVLGLSMPWSAGAEDAPAPAAGRKVIVYREDKLTLDLEKVPLADVMTEVGKQSGAEVRGEILQQRDLTLEMDETPLKEALERLLGEQNFTLTYGDDGKLRTVELKGGREEAPPPVAETEKAEDEDAVRATQDKLFRLFDKRDRVLVTGKVAERWGDDRILWDRLGNTTYGDPDEATRREAVRNAMRAVENDPEFRDAIVAAAAALTDAEMAQFVRERCYNRADELVRNIARSTDDVEFRTRARSVLRELKKIPFQGPEPEELARQRVQKSGS